MQVVLETEDSFKDVLINIREKHMRFDMYVWSCLEKDCKSEGEII
jgi:hypothetical protein